DESGRNKRQSIQACINDCAERTVSFHPEPDVSRALFAAGRARIFSERLDHAAVRRSPGLDHALRRHPARREISHREIRRTLSGIETRSAPLALKARTMSILASVRRRSQQQSEHSRE